jgi:hypothetical protein
MSRYLWWVTLVSGVVLDALLAGTLAVLTTSTDRGITFVWFFLAILLLPAAVSLWGLCKSAVTFFGPAKRLMVREYLRVFKTGRFPEQYAVDLDTYLATIVDSEEAPLPTRLRAAHLSGQLAGLKVGKPIAVGMANYIAAEAALHEYQDEFGPRRRADPPL